MECKRGRRRDEGTKTRGDRGGGKETWAESVVNTCTESESTDYLGALPRILTQTGM